MQLTIALAPARRGGTERPPEHRAQVVLELARVGAFDRPVAAVVPPAAPSRWRAASVEIKQLDARDADVVELVEEGTDALLGACLERCGRSPARVRASGAGSRVVRVLDHGPARDRAVEAAHRDDRQLTARTARTPPRMSGTPPTSAHAGSASPVSRSTAWPLPS
jgi:hypothetical protein